MRGLDVDDHVERVVGKRQVLGIALDEFESRDRMALFAERDAGRVEIEAGVFRRSLHAGEVGRAAAVAAADFQHLLAVEIHLRADVVIELDARAVRLVLGGERDGHRRVGLKGVVQENHLFAVQPPRQERIPEFPDRLADRGDGKQMVNEWHGARKFYALRISAMATAMSGARKVEEPATITFAPAV